MSHAFDKSFNTRINVLTVHLTLPGASEKKKRTAWRTIGEFHDRQTHRARSNCCASVRVASRARTYIVPFFSRAGINCSVLIKIPPAANRYQRRNTVEREWNLVVAKSYTRNTFHDAPVLYGTWNSAFARRLGVSTDITWIFFRPPQWRRCRAYRRSVDA